jgi:DNA-binding PadR family transcriptional regulator
LGYLSIPDHRYGRSPTDIQLRCIDTKQDYNKINNCLKDLSNEGFLEIFPTSKTGGKCVKITDAGREEYASLKMRRYLFRRLDLNQNRYTHEERLT